MLDAVKLEREKRRTLKLERKHLQEDRIYSVLLSPNMIRLGMICGIIAYSTWEMRSPHNVGPVRSAVAMALPMIGIPIIAADAGIRDKWALAAIAGVGAAYVTGQTIAGWAGAAGSAPSTGGLDLALDLAGPLAGPFYPLLKGLT